jgi:hypothetical protein
LIGGRVTSGIKKSVIAIARLKKEMIKQITKIHLTKISQSNTIILPCLIQFNNIIPNTRVRQSVPAKSEKNEELALSNIMNKESAKKIGSDRYLTLKRSDNINQPQTPPNMTRGSKKLLMKYFSEKGVV